MSADHGAKTKIPTGAKRLLVAAVLFLIVAFLQQTNSSLLHFLPNDLLTRDEIRVTSQPKLVGDSYTVTRVVDGDTLAIDYNGVREKVRLIGINTPETVDPRKPVECFGKEASNRMKDLVEGKKVYLETDSTQGERDKYGRLLAYIYLEDGQMVNRKMLAEGYAYEYTYLRPYKYQQEFKDFQIFAKNSKVGLWADGVCATSQLNH